MRSRLVHWAGVFTLALAGIAGAAAPATATGPSQVLLSTDFADAAVQTYADGVAIGKDQMTSRIAAEGCSVAVQEAGGAHVLEFASDGRSTLAHATHGAVRLLPKGIAEMTGSVSFTVLPCPAGATRGVFGIHLFSSAQYLTTGGVSITGIVISQGYLNQRKLLPGKQYRIDTTVDCTDPTQHTWGYRIYEQGGQQPIFESLGQKTRNPQDPPVMFALTAAGTPYIQVQKVEITGRVGPSLATAAKPAAAAVPASQPALPADDDSIICNHARAKNAPPPAEVRCKNAVTAGRILLFARGAMPSIELPIQNDRAQAIPADYVLSLQDRQGTQLDQKAGAITLAPNAASSVTYALDTKPLKYGVYSLVLRVTTKGQGLTDREYYVGVISDTKIPKAAEGEFLYGLDPNYGGVIEKAPKPADGDKRAQQGQASLIEWVDAMGVDILRSGGCIIGVESAFRDPLPFLEHELPILRQHGVRLMGMAVPVVPPTSPLSKPGSFERQRKQCADAIEDLARKVPDVIYWEMGNEPDLGYPSMETYVQVYEEMYQAVKRGNPKAQVMNGALTFFGAKGPGNSRKFVELVKPEYIDVFAYHAHGPGSLAEKRIYEQMAGTVAEFGKTGKPLVDTESGMFVGSKKQEDMQAWMVLQKQTYAQSKGLKFLMTFRLHAFRSETGWGLLRSDQEPQPAILAYRTMAEHLKGLAFQKTLTMTQEQAEGYTFAQAGGPRRACVLWSNQPAFYNAYLKIAASSAQTKSVRLMDVYGNESAADVGDDGVVHVEVTEAPVYVLWDAVDGNTAVMVVRSMLRTADMATVIPDGTCPLPLSVENASDAALTATLSASINAPGDARITPPEQTLTIPPRSSLPVSLEVQWKAQQQGLIWPDNWTVYSDVPEDVKLGAIVEVPTAIGQARGRQVTALKGVIGLLQPGELPREKRAGLVLGTVQSDRPQTLRIGVAADWWMEFRVNGQLVCDTLEKGNGSLGVTERLLDIPLKEGSNLLAFKVLSGRGGWSLTLASPSQLPSLLDPRKANNCIDLVLRSQDKVLARERLALLPVQRIAAVAQQKWDDPLERWESSPHDLDLGAVQVINLFDKQPDRSKWWQGVDDLSATGWMRCDQRRLYLVLRVLDDKDMTGAEPEKIRWFDCLRVAISRDGKTMDEYSIGRMGTTAAVYKEQSTRGLAKGQVDAKAEEIQVQVERQPKQTIYRVALDRTMVGDGAFRLNLLVNDNDEGYRKQFLLYSDDHANMGNPPGWRQFILSATR